MSGLLLPALAVAGCPSDDTGEEGAGTTEVGTSTTSDGTTTTTSGSTTAVAESSTGEPETTGLIIPECHEERPLPEPPAVDCSGATETLMGSAIIEDGGDDISILENVREVTGAIRINRMPFTDLDFLACIDTVGADITIFGNEMLTDVSGLHNVTSLNDFVFSSNDAIEDFNGLPLLEQWASTAWASIRRRWRSPAATSPSRRTRSSRTSTASVGCR
jgi:hypothetical protein